MLVKLMKFQIKDIIDILLVASLLYLVYKRIKGTIAFNIFLGLCLFIAFWWLVQALDMELLSWMLNGVASVGVLAVIVLFQPEIRKFLVLLGSKYQFNSKFSFDKFVSKEGDDILSFYLNPIIQASCNMAKKNIGAIIIITKQANLVDITQTGELLNAVISTPLLESIFSKDSPLHDGAVVIADNKIKAASCLLPISYNTDLPKEMGLRHRAGLGISQHSDARVIIVSEERGEVSFAVNGKLHRDLDSNSLKTLLQTNFSKPS